MLRVIQRSNRIGRGNVGRLSLSSTSSARDYTYFDNLEIKDGVCVVRFNGPGKMNTISKGMQEDAQKILMGSVAGNKDIKAVVFISSKSDNFIAGADIDMLKATTDKAELKTMTMKAHSFFKELKSTAKIPFIAAINGAALGGGLEWAMYCDYRIATTSKKTVLGLPEVKLGLMPGMAGTYHLPKLVGLRASLDMMLTGKNVRPDKAKKMGLVDLVVDPDVLESVAITQALGLANGTVKRTSRKLNLQDKLLEGNPLGRHFLFKEARKTVTKTTGGKYPAPYAILDVVENNFGKDMMTHLNDEATKFSQLAATPESEALIGLFHGTTAVKKHNYGNPSHKVETIGVLGAGLMGGGIAQVSADQGKYKVLLKDRDAAAVSRGEKNIASDLKKKLDKKRMTHYEFSSTTSRIVPVHDGDEVWKRHFSHADLVIEAVFEDISVKHKVLQEMEAIMPAHGIFASNTSAIPIAQIAAGAKRPERVIGMHYFSPVPAMPLLEIILHDGTAPEVAAAAMEVGTKQGKTCIFVKDVAGFYVNRCLSPFMTEVTNLVFEGADLQVLDKALKDFGMPVGPITLADEVGIDVSAHVGAFMQKSDLGVRMAGGRPEVMQKMLEKGFLGRKTGKGFYLYPADQKGSKSKQINPEVAAMLTEIRQSSPAKQISVEDMQMRTISRFVNEAAYCLQDGIIRAPADGDIGAVFGIGFPPFLGGPFRMLDIKGTKQFVDRMFRYRDAHGEQFEPCQLLKDMAASGKKFHN